MTVRKAIEKPKDEPVDIEALISKGARVIQDVSNKKTSSQILLRIPTFLLNLVDEAMKDRVGISRNGWILEAIQENLKRAIRE